MDPERYQHLEIVTDDRITTVTINRPDVRNAINGELHEEFSTVFTDLDRDDDTDVIILTGAGDCFSAGGDLNWVREQCGNALLCASTNRASRRIQHSLLDLEKPIISKVRGPAVGLGCSLSLMCDFVFATPNARFADPHVSVGLVAGDGGPIVWPQLIGYARARRYLLTGDPITGEVAAEIGLITEAVADDELDDVVDAMAQRMLNGATYAIRFTKSAINAALKATAAPVLDRATGFETVTQMLDHNRMAVDALLAKSQPTFR